MDDEAEPSCDVALSLQKGAGNFTLAFDFQDAKNFYALELTPQSAAFSLTKNGVKTTLSRAPLSLAAQNSLVLQRRPWRMQLIANGQVALRAFDASFTTGQIGTAGSWKAGEIRVQPVESLRFDDDFTRAGSGQTLEWKTESGRWVLSASSEHVSARNAEMSSNPFAFEVEKSANWSLASNGRWFWDSYDARVAARPEDAGTLALAVYFKDAKNYLAFEWDGKNSPSARRLVQVKNGVKTTLATGAGAFLPGQWYEIGVRTSPGFLEAILDGVPVLRAQTEALGQGGVALAAQNTRASFDDVQVRSYDFLRPIFAVNGSWKTGSGAWKLLGQSAQTQAPSTLLFGPPDGDAYRALLSLPNTAGAEVGLIAGFKDPKNYALFVLKNGRAQILQFQNGISKTLFDAPRPAMKGAPRVQLEAMRGVLTVSGGGQIWAQASANGLTRGQFGLYAKPGATSKTALTFADPVLFYPPPPEPIKVAPRMENDAYMVGWASPTGQWPPSPGANGLEFWNTGEYFGDFELRFPWRAAWRGSFEVALRAKRGSFESGLLLRGAASDDKTSVNWTLARAGKTLASGSIKLADLADVNSAEGAVLTLASRGQGLVLSSQNTPILSYLDTQEGAGSSLAVRSSGFRVRAERLLVQNQNADDYTFTGAPTDFYALSGRWSIFSRWPCYGDWSFFGGVGRNPTLWTKRSYSGDVVAEMYAHPQMTLPKEPGYSHPGDLNISLCGDGKNLSSGYSFILAGFDNTKTVLMKGDKIVATREDDLARFSNTTNHNTRWHRRWFYVRAEARRAQKDGKNGVQIALYVDEEKLVDWFDEAPLSSFENGGRVAFWSADNTMMVARAKIEAQNLGLRALPSGLLPVSVPVPGGAPTPIAEGENPAPLVEKSGDGWKVTNAVSGGLFAVDLAKNLALSPESKLSFEAKMDAETNLDLYARVGDDWFKIALQDAEKLDAIAPTLGAAKKSAGTKPGFSRFEFPVGAALQKEIGGQKWTVAELRLGALSGGAYAWAGLEGNPYGASYEVRALSFGGA